ncbi:MAG: hypothetical protein IJ823_03355 [Bacteroidales bacterium]|nr:hypothetical protein [Bacteroidales bacterium]
MKRKGKLPAFPIWKIRIRSAFLFFSGKTTVEPEKVIPGFQPDINRF